MSYKYEFPDYDDELPVIDGFKDESWHNDVCPSMEKRIYNDAYLKLWCDYRNPEMREIGGNQYIISYFDDATMNSVPMFSSDDIEEVKKFIKQFLKLNGKE